MRRHAAASRICDAARAPYAARCGIAAYMCRIRTREAARGVLEIRLSYARCGVHAPYTDPILTREAARGVRRLGPHVPQLVLGRGWAVPAARRPRPGSNCQCTDPRSYASAPYLFMVLSAEVRRPAAPSRRPQRLADHSVARLRLRRGGRALPRLDRERHDSGYGPLALAARGAPRSLCVMKDTISFRVSHHAREAPRSRLSRARRARGGTGRHGCEAGTGGGRQLDRSDGRGDLSAGDVASRYVEMLGVCLR